MPEEDSKKTSFRKPHSDSLASQSSQDVPKFIGPYKIESLLKKGGMSLLYLATHPATKEPVTIKVLSPRFLSSPEARLRFLNEAEMIATIDHPNIVKLYDHGEWEGGLYIAMEFIQGISLRQAILQSPISLKRALEIIVEIAYAMCHLHTHGIIHRDLKPENILITETNQVKVIDFGIAQVLNENNQHPAPDKPRLIGTPIYMSPEQRENPESVSYPSDIYSLGIIAYELILGKLSHGQIHLSLMPKGIQKILTKALQPKPQDRYQDIVDFITDILTYLNSSSMQKEKKVGDRLSELSENLHLAQSMLTPLKLLEWEQAEFGISSQKMSSVYGSYYDSFKLPNNAYGILIGESLAKGAEGMIYLAILRGMIHALEPLADQPVTLIRKLNTLIAKDKRDQVLTLSYLVLFPALNQLSYISCGGHSRLWKLSAASDTPLIIEKTHIALGIEDVEFKDVILPWETGDTLIFESYAADQETDTEVIQKIIQENAKSPPQKIVDAILRKITFASTRPSPDRLPLFIAIRRK